MEAKDRVTLLEANLARQLQWISWSDTKSAFIFTLAAAMVGLLAAVAPEKAGTWTTAQAISAAFVVAGSAATFCFLSLAAFPRTDGPKGSLVYCGGVAARDASVYRKEILAVSFEEYADDLTAQCHRNASIACEKFKWIQRALISLYLSITPWTVATWLLYNAGAN